MLSLTSKSGKFRVVFLAACALLGAQPATAKLAISTLANASISADTAGGNSAGISGPALDEGSTGDIGLGTIILNAPSGFSFDPGATVAATVTRIAGGGTAVTLSSGTAVVTTSTITITVTAVDSSGGTKSRVAWSGIRVRPAAGTPLVTGNITPSGSSSLKGLNTSSNLGTLTEVAGAAVQLAFARQPAAGVAGTPFATQPVVVAQDQFGNASTNGLPATRNITLSLTSGMGPLQGTLTLNIGMAGGDGTIIYSGLRIDVAGADKRLTATADAALTAATSSTFTVSPGAASLLVLATQPSSSAAAGVPFAQQPVILIADAFSNVRSNDALTVSAARLAGTGNLVGTTNVTASGGVAAFSNLAHLIANNITIQFSSGSLTQAVSTAINITPQPFSQLQVLLPGETAAPGTSSGKIGSAWSQRLGVPFNIIVSAVDQYWNISATNDGVHVACTDLLADLPPDRALSGGTAAFSVTANTGGTQTLTVSDVTQPGIPSATSASFFVGVAALVLPGQPDVVLNELQPLSLVNTATEIGISNPPSGAPFSTNTIIFNYASRTALLADGWSYIATLPGGIPRNTEITNTADGAVVDYDQTVHPGVLRIPVDVGDEWGSANNSRNSIFRSLPANWVSMRLACLLTPTIAYQQMHLMFYQDDDNFIQAGLAYNPGLGGEATTLVWETNAIVNHIPITVTNISSISVRLDHDLSTGNITGYRSYDGINWILFGTVPISLSNTRLGIWVGGSLVAWTPGMAVCDLQRLDVITSTSSPAIAYQLVNPPSGATIDGNGVITWTPTEAQGPGTNVITTVATDNSQQPPLTATNSFRVVVNEINTPPALPPIPTQTLIDQVLLSVTNTATDTDIPANPLTYSLLSAPDGAAIDTNGVITWTPSAAQVPSSNYFVTVVTDTNPWAVNATSLSTTNAFTVLVSTNAQLRLPRQADRVIDELTALVVSNTAIGGQFASQVLTNTYNFTYSSRTALLADGWSFIATLPDGTSRDTEITNSTQGAVANYSQTSHPGALRIPCDLGDLWGSYNNSRNSLFRPLPNNWLSMQLALSFAPLMNDEQAHLVLYQDDDNYVEVGLAYNGWEKTALDQETAGAAATLATADVAATNVQLRLDNSPASGAVTLSYSAEGGLLTSLGTVTPSLVNPRLGIWVGGSPVAYTNGLPNCDLRRVDIVWSNRFPSVLNYQLINSPSGASIDTNGVITWTPSEAQGPSTNVFTTVVTDNGIPPVAATNSFTVVVNEVNTAPVLPAQTSRLATPLMTMIVTNTATDSDFPPNPLGYLLLDAPAGALIDTNGIITWIPSVAQTPSTNLFTTVVTDFNPWAVNAQNLSATNQFTVVVPAVAPQFNRPPMLPIQPNRTLLGADPLVVYNAASDPDFPPNPLTYVLLSAPAGALIDSNGIITWTPTEAQVPSTNLFETQVTDYNPWAINEQHLSDVNSFVVVVAIPGSLFIQSISITNGVAVISWNSQPGQTYRLQYTDNMLAPAWQDVLPAVTATGSTTTATNAVGPTTERYYRIVQ